jgi:predicted dehydrogenase
VQSPRCFQRLGTPPAVERRSSIATTNAAGGARWSTCTCTTSDFAYHLLRAARRFVSAAGSLDHVSALYHFGGAGARRTSWPKGAWDHTPGWFSFRMRFIVVFERGTADYDIGRTPQLLLCRDGKQETISLEAGAGYDFQVREVVSAIREKRAARATIDEALEVARVLDAERRSLRESARVAVR